MATMNTITKSGLQQMASTQGFRVEPILNTTAVAQDGAALRIMGFTLRGPRGNRTTVEVMEDGRIRLDPIKLWLDGIAYSTAKIAAKAK